MSKGSDRTRELLGKMASRGIPPPFEFGPATTPQCFEIFDSLLKGSGEHGSAPRCEGKDTDVSSGVGREFACVGA